jgi:hypothetical protein
MDVARISAGVRFPWLVVNYKGSPEVDGSKEKK